MAMNLFHCRLHPEGYGNWRAYEYAAITRDGEKPPAYLVVESDRLPWFGQFPDGENAVGWFASEAEELADCDFVRSLDQGEYCIVRGWGHPLSANFVYV